ncbi:MAG: STAS domain-containing protein [Sphingomonas sp.]|jgi:anti-anti-sigma regulatory factor|uniref:STAS domain-containing protein n=1 Tax=Sphingomonas sp. TaxID=28214 RepID=UPI003561FCF8
MPHSTLILPARCDRQAVDDLIPELRAAVAAGDVMIDGGGVVQFGQAMLQVLFGARKMAFAHQTALTVSASDAMRATLTMIGADHLLDGGDAR